MDPSRRVAELVARSPRSLLAVAAAFTLAAAVLAAQIRLDVDLLSVFDPQGPDRQLADEFAATFGSDQASLVAVVTTVGDAPLGEAAVEAVADLSDQAATVEGVERVASITTTGVVRPSGVGDPERLFGPAFADDLADLPIAERVALARNGRLGSRQLLAADGSVLLVVAVLDADLATHDQRFPVAERFRQVLDAAAADHADSVTVAVAGLQFTTIETVERTRADLMVLAPVLVAAMLIITWLYFRRLWTVVAMVTAVVPSVLLTLAVMWMLGDNLNQFTTAFPVLLIGMTVATGTHLIHRFFTVRAQGTNPEASAWATARSVSGVSLLCAATNAIGFLSLLIASMPVLRQFGLYLAIGVGFSFVCTALLIPAVLHVAAVEPPAAYRHQQPPPGHQSGHRLANHAGSRTDRWSRAYANGMARPPVALAVTMLGVVAFIGGGVAARNAIFDYSVARDFPPGSTITEANALVDTELDGSIPVEISLRGQPGSWLEPDNLRRIQTFDQFLIDQEGLYTLGLPSVLAEMEQLSLDLPTTTQETEGLIEALVDANPDTQAVVDQLLTTDRSWTRLSALRPEDGANAYLEMIDRVESQAATIFAGTGIEVEVTGNAAVSFRGVDQLTGELVQALGLAVAMVVAAIAVTFHSLQVAAVTILPNALPLVIGFAGYLLVYGQADPLMAGVFVIVLGIAADDTVHLANRYLSLLGRGYQPGQAVAQAFVDLRPAMMSSTVVLVSAFGALLAAAMPSTRTIGWLGGGVLLLALISDLVFGLAGISLLAAWHQHRGVRLRDRRLAISPTTDRLPAPRPADPRPLLARHHVMVGLSVASITLLATAAVLLLGRDLHIGRGAALGLFLAAALGLGSSLAARPPTPLWPEAPQSDRTAS